MMVHPFPDLYGSDRCLLSTIDGLTDRGWHVTILLPEHGRLEGELAKRPAEVEVLSFPVLRKSLLTVGGIVRLGLAFPRELMMMQRTLRRLKPDVLLVNTLTLPHWLLAARLRRIPSICHVHELEGSASPLLARALVWPVSLSTRVVVNSQATARFLARAAKRLERKVVLVYNGVTIDAVAETQPAPQPFRLVVVGRLSPNKGQDVALEALARLVSHGHDVTLELVGDAFRGYEWLQDQLVTRAAEPDLNGRVIFRGFLENPAESYSRAHVVLVPSRNEPFGNVAVEAQLMNRPVVASRVGGLPEIVHDCVTGRLVPPANSDALADAVEELLLDSEQRDRLAQAGLMSARDRFSVERYEREMAQVVASVSAER